MRTDQLQFSLGRWIVHRHGATRLEQLFACKTVKQGAFGGQIFSLFEYFVFAHCSRERQVSGEDAEWWLIPLRRREWSLSMAICSDPLQTVRCVGPREQWCVPLPAQYPTIFPYSPKNVECYGQELFQSPLVQRIQRKIDLYQTPSSNDTRQMLQRLTTIIQKHVPDFSFKDSTTDKGFSSRQVKLLSVHRWSEGEENNRLLDWSCLQLLITLCHRQPASLPQNPIVLPSLTDCSIEKQATKNLSPNTHRFALMSPTIHFSPSTYPVLKRNQRKVLRHRFPSSMKLVLQDQRETVRAAPDCERFTGCPLDWQCLAHLQAVIQWSEIHYWRAFQYHRLLAIRNCRFQRVVSDLA